MMCQYFLVHLFCHRTASLKDGEKAGALIVAKALESPLYNIAQNSGFDGSVVVTEAKEMDREIGFDAISGTFVNMFDTGIIDPVKVARCALQNSASIASLLLTVKSVITEIKKKEIEGAVK